MQAMLPILSIHKFQAKKSPTYKSGAFLIMSITTYYY